MPRLWHDVTCSLGGDGRRDPGPPAVTEHGTLSDRDKHRRAPQREDRESAESEPSPFRTIQTASTIACRPDGPVIVARTSYFCPKALGCPGEASSDLAMARRSLSSRCQSALVYPRAWKKAALNRRKRYGDRFQPTWRKYHLHPPTPGCAVECRRRSTCQFQSEAERTVRSPRSIPGSLLPAEPSRYPRP